MTAPGAITDPEIATALNGSRMYSRIHGLCLRELREHHLAEDLTSETILAALRAWATFENRTDGGLYAWLATIARHKIVDHHRARQRRPLEDLTDTVPDRASAEPGPEEIVIRRETVREAVTELRDHIARLGSPLQRAVLTALADGHSLDDIATHLGLEKSPVKMARHRGIRGIRRGAA